MPNNFWDGLNWKSAGQVIVMILGSIALIIVSAASCTTNDKDKVTAHENRKAKEAEADIEKWRALGGATGSHSAAPQQVAFTPSAVSAGSKCDNTGYVFLVKAGETRTLEHEKVLSGVAGGGCELTHDINHTTTSGTEFEFLQCSTSDWKSLNTQSVGDAGFFAAIKSGCVQIRVSRGQFHSFLQRRV